MPYDLLSLFCGSGGLDYGFELAGFNTVLALDHSDDAVRTFNENFAPGVAQVADLSCLQPDAFLALIPTESHPIGLVGGPPCQGYSRGNVGSNVDDPRNKLPFQFAALLKAANQQHTLHFFVFENVVRLTSSKYAEHFAQIQASLRDAGFNIFQAELNASDFAVPQRRHRLFIVGLNAQLYPGVSFAFPVGTQDRRYVRDAIFGMPPPAFYARHLTPETIPHHQNHWTMVPKSPKFQSQGTTTGRSFKRIDWNEFSPTVAYGHREVHVHPDGGRRLSVLESMLLQGFPFQYKLTGTLSAQITQISNAVPPPMAEAVAIAVRTYIERREQILYEHVTAREDM
jgi:DNA (cytosine-5)-methyltransferase 1